MAHIETRTLSDGKKAYRVRWTDPAGVERKKQFRKKGDARTPGTAVHFKTQIEAELSRGTYVDPNAGDQTFKQYAEEWRANLHQRSGSDDRLESILRLHVYPVLGAMRIGAIRRRDVQSLVKTLTVKPIGNPKRDGSPTPCLSPSYIENIMQLVAGAFRAAVVDEVIQRTPCVKLNLPEVTEQQVIIPTFEQVVAIADRMPQRYRAMVLLAAATGLRSGELRGLDVERVQFLQRPAIVRVDRQLITPKSGPALFGPPKSKAGHRDVPLAASMAEILARHIEQHGWGLPGTPNHGTGLPLAACGTTGLLFSNRSRKPVSRQSVNDPLREIMADMGLPARSGMHLFRHYYASQLIRLGEDSKTIQTRLGHATMAETMDTYGHLFPDTEDRSGSALDAIFAAVPPGASQGREGATGASTGGRPLSIVSSHASGAAQVGT